MEKIFVVLSSILLFSCNDDLTLISQEIVYGKVSAIVEGSGQFGRGPTIHPKIYIQNSTQTKEVVLPFENENRFKVGDSCLLIIEKYKETTK